MLKSTAFTFGTLLALYLGGLGLGTLLGALWVRRSRHPTQAFLALQAGIGLYAGISLFLFVGSLESQGPLAPLWRYFSAEDIVPVGLERKFLSLYFLLPAFLVGPPTLLMGLSFPFLQKAAQADLAYLGRRVGWLQTANIAGSLLGTVLTGLAGLAVLGTATTGKVLVALGMTFLLLWVQLRYAKLPQRKKMLSVAAGVLVLVLIARMPGAETLWAKLHGTSPERTLFAEDASGLSLLKSEEPQFSGRTRVFANGLSQSWIPYEGIHTLLGALPVLMHPDPRKIAVIGLGSGDTLFSIGGRPEVSEMTCIEIIGSELPVLKQLAARFPYPALRHVLNDKRIRFLIGDGRAFLMQSKESYDIIEADALRPDSAYAGNLYSYEYFTLLKRHLKPRGLAVSWAPTNRVHDTFLKAFPYVLSFEGTVVIGSNRPIEFDADKIRSRMESSFVRGYYSLAGIDVPGLIAPWTKERKPVFFGPNADRSGLRDINSDLFPKDEYQIPRLP